MVLSSVIGNSYIKFALLDDDDNIVLNFSVSSKIPKSSDEYRLLIKSFLADGNFSPCVSSSVISSVVPTLTSEIYNALSSVSASRPFIIGSGTKTGFKIRINNSSELGADIVSNAAAAISRYIAPIIIIDVGTATTFTVVDKAGDVIGAVIHPGLKISQDILSSSAAQLYDVPLIHPKKLIGQNSAESIQSGLINGHICMIDGMITKLKNEICDCDHDKVSVVATGDFARNIVPYCDNKIDICPDLTILGSTSLLRLNRKLC